MLKDHKGQYLPAGTQPKYLVAEHWGHCFVGSKESTVRWVLEIGVGVIAGQVRRGSRWDDMHRSEIVDIQEEIDDNSVVEHWQTEHEGSIVMTTELPEWATRNSVPPVDDYRSVLPVQAEAARKTMRRFWEYQRRRGKFDTVLTLRMSDPGGTLIGWVVARDPAVLRRTYPFTQETFGWDIRRERAHDDNRRHVRNLPISPESQPVTEQVPA